MPLYLSQFFESPILSLSRITLNMCMHAHTHVSREMALNHVRGKYWMVEMRDVFIRVAIRYVF